MKIAVTGSLSSGKSTVTKLIAKKNFPIFDADIEVKKLYKNKKFKFKIQKLLKIKNSTKIKNEVRIAIKNKSNLRKLEKLIHPMIRKRMRIFTKEKKKYNILIFEIPLLVESKLTKFFDLNIFVSSKKNLRLKRYKDKGGSTETFNILNNRQLDDRKKAKYCDYVITNNSSISVLKKRVSYIVD